MKDMVIIRGQVNMEALNADLRATLGESMTGISFSHGSVTIHLLNSATSQQESQAQQIVQAHDPGKLTPWQQAELARRARLDQLRGDYGAAEIDTATYSTQPVLVQKLAQKIAWLEQEIFNLRPGG